MPYVQNPWEHAHVSAASTACRCAAERLCLPDSFVCAWFCVHRGYDGCLTAFLCVCLVVCLLPPCIMGTKVALRRTALARRSSSCGLPSSYQAACCTYSFYLAYTASCTSTYWQTKQHQLNFLSLLSSALCSHSIHTRCTLNTRACKHNSTKGTRWRAISLPAQLGQM